MPIVEASTKFGNRFRYRCEDCKWVGYWEPTVRQAVQEGQRHKTGSGHYRQCSAGHSNSVDHATATIRSEPIPAG